MRFELIHNPILINSVINNILYNGFKEINGNTGGDNDFICIDMLNKEWCWCESGFEPFSYEGLLPFQDKNGALKLTDLVKIRY